MRQVQRTIAVMIGAAGLALGASAQEECSQSSECSETKSSSCTTISSNGDTGSYEVRFENGELMVVKVDGKHIDLDECEFDQEAGVLVLERDGESFVVQIPGGPGGNLVTAPIAISSGTAFFPGQPTPPRAPGVIEWADAPDAPQAPGMIFYDDGAASSWAFEGDEPRVMIGITHDEVGEDHRAVFDLDEGEGIYIIDVREGLPAAEAGVRAGDIIIEVDGEYIDDREVLADILEDQEPGDRLRIVVLREDGDGEVIKKKLRLKLAEYNRFVLRGGEGQGMAGFPGGGEWLHAEGDNFEFPEELALFGDFEFEMPEGLDDLPPEVRQEVMRALEMARERAHNTQARAYQLRVERGDHQRAIEQHERAVRSNQRSAQGHTRHNEHLENLHEHLGQLREHGEAINLLDMEELAKLREHGVDIQIQMGDELESLRELGLRLHELGGNEQIIRSSPNGRAFIIEREINRDNNDQADQRRDRSSERRLRTERDTLLDRNQTLEDRVEALERRLAELMERLEERDR